MNNIWFAVAMWCLAAATVLGCESRTSSTPGAEVGLVVTPSAKPKFTELLAKAKHVYRQENDGALRIARPVDRPRLALELVDTFYMRNGFKRDNVPPILTSEGAVYCCYGAPQWPVHEYLLAVHGEKFFQNLDEMIEARGPDILRQYGACTDCRIASKASPRSLEIETCDSQSAGLLKAFVENVTAQTAGSRPFVRELYRGFNYDGALLTYFNSIEIEVSARSCG